MKNPYQGSLIDLCLAMAGLIVSMYSYMYFLSTISVVNILLSALLMFPFTNISQLNRLWSDTLCQHEGVVPNDFMTNFAFITNHTQKIVLLLKPCTILVLFFSKSLSLKANKLYERNNVKVFKLFKITLYHQLLSFLLYHLICSDIIRSNLIRSGNVQENPDPNDCNLKFFHWNLDSLTAGNNTKISLIDVCNSVFNYDLIAVSDTRLNQSIDNEDIRIEGFSSDIFRSDLPSNSRVPGRAFIYYKENIPIKRRKDLEILQECVVTEVHLVVKSIFHRIIPPSTPN